MPDLHQKLLPEPIRRINSASFDGTFQPFLDENLVASPITNPSRSLLIVNNSGVIVTISWDGVKGHVDLAAGAGYALDESANAYSSTSLATSANTQFYAKGTASTGYVNLSTFYAS
jgi:hypothetical protein